MGDPGIHEVVADDLRRSGWSARDDFLPEELAGRLRAEAVALHRAGRFRPAAVGRGTERQIDAAVREEEILWLRPPHEPAQREFLREMERLRQAINRELFLGLFDFEGHLARFPVGGFYERHLDRFREGAARVVSAILYLNENWSEDDGGCLRLFLDAGAIDVPPQQGTLVTFLSARLPHEVLRCRRERYSIGGWFRTRAREALPVHPEVEDR